jgi:hypothetical protein
MPNIIEYNAPTHLAPEPSDRASSSHAMAARRIDISYNQAGAAYEHLGREVGSTVADLGRQYVDYQAHKEISQGGLAAAQLLAGATQSWKDTVRTTDPNEPTLQKRFLGDQIEPALQKFQQGFITEKGQNWAQQQSDRIRRHFYNTTSADMSTLAGVAAHNNFIQTVNTLTGMVDKHPEDISMVTDMMTDQIHNLVESSPGMKGAAAEKFRMDATEKGMEMVVKAAIQADIRRGGDGSSIADDPKYMPYVNAAERHQFEQQQRQMERFQRADERYQRQVEKQEQQDKGQEGVNKIITGLRSDHPEQFDMQSIIRMKENGELPGPWFEHAIRIYDRETKEETPARISQENARDLYKRIRLPEGDPDRLKDPEAIHQAYVNDDPSKQINKADRDDLIKTFYEFRTPESNYLAREVQTFGKAFEPQLNQSIMGKALDVRGGERYKYFMDGLWTRIDQMKREGKDAQTIVNTLLKPTSKDYYGTQENVNAWVADIDKRARSAVQGADKRRPLDEIIKVPRSQ